jgi:hypothetical protein
MILEIGYSPNSQFAMENGPFIGHLPIKKSHFPKFFVCFPEDKTH